MRTQTTFSLGLIAVALILTGAGCGKQTSTKDERSDLSDKPIYNEQATASINVANQVMADSTVTIPKITLGTDGWLVIHANENGVPGQVIGQVAVSAGEYKDMKITVDTKKITPIVHAILHVDLGKKGIFEYPGDDVPVTANNVAVSGSFEVTIQAKEIDTKTSVKTETKVNVQVKTDTKTEVKADLKSSVKSFTLTAKNWGFSPATITVKKGDTVKLTITSVDVDHGFALPEFNVDKKFKAGETVNVEFVADKTGTFGFFCNVFCGAGHKSMKGTLIVQ